MKTYRLLFLILTLAELVFTINYYLITKKMDSIVLAGAIIYAGGMLIAFIGYQAGKYRRRRKELLDSLP